MSALLDRLDWRCVVAARRIAFVGVLGMLAIAILTVADVLLRWLFSESVPGFNEILEMSIAVAIAATLPAGVAGRVNLTIDILGPRFGVRGLAWLKATGALSLLVFYFFLAWRVGVTASELSARNARTVYLEFPQAPFIWTIAGLMVISTIAQLVAYLVSVRDAMAGGEDGDGTGHGGFSGLSGAEQQRTSGSRAAVPS